MEGRLTMQYYMYAWGVHLSQRHLSVFTESCIRSDMCMRVHPSGTVLPRPRHLVHLGRVHPITPIIRAYLWHCVSGKSEEKPYEYDIQHVPFIPLLVNLCIISMDFWLYPQHVLSI